MKRDITIPISLIGLLVIFALGFFLGPDLKDFPRFVYLIYTVFSVIIFLRVFFLWFQTLIHSSKEKSENMRVIWILAHVFFGPVTSFFYYFSNDPRLESEMAYRDLPDEKEPTSRER